MSEPYLLTALTALTMTTVEMMEAIARVRNASCDVSACGEDDEMQGRLARQFSSVIPNNYNGRTLGHFPTTLEDRELTMSSRKLTRAEILPFARTATAAPMTASPANPMPMQ